MKVKIFTLLFMVMSVFAFAQESEHLSFKGVPIDGKLSEYVSQMEKRGFKHIGTENNASFLTGNFAGYRNCYIGIVALDEDLVYRVGVKFPDYDTWSNLSDNYFSLKEMLEKKYGKASDVVEKFESYSQPKNDQARMYDVEFDRYKYYSTWEVKNGMIQLSIEHDGISSCYVMLIYEDKVNGTINRKQAIDDL